MTELKGIVLASTVEGRLYPALPRLGWAREDAERPRVPPKSNYGQGMTFWIQVPEEAGEQCIANAAFRLNRDNHPEVASLLLRSKLTSKHYPQRVPDEDETPPTHFDPDTPSHVIKEHYTDYGRIHLRLVAPIEIESYFTPTVLERVAEAFQPDWDASIEEVVVTGLADISPGWRDRAESEIAADRPDNQAALMPLPSDYPTEDRLKFRSGAERRVYRVLKSFQEQAAEVGDSLTIVPLPACRFPKTTLEPDFIIIYRGRAMALEVDGPHHERRRDTNRDNLLRIAGFRDVRRIDVRDTANDDELADALRTFLKQMLRD